MVSKRVLWMAGGAAALVLAAAPLIAADDRARLTAAKQQAAQAQARAEALDAAAAAERNEARKAEQLEAAVAARIQRAEADIAAAQARIGLVRAQLADQRTRLAQQQQPIARLIAALQSLARRPAAISLVQPGSVSDLVHVRAVLATVSPVVQARTATLRDQLDRTRRLEAGQRVAVQSLADGRAALDAQRLALARLEAAHRLKSRDLGRGALFESDRAIALGEQARDLVDQISRASDVAAIRADLESLPAPLPRPLKPGEVPPPADVAGWSTTAPPYRLPVAGKLIVGLGEESGTGVRSRGLTIEAAAAAQAVAPAAGRVLFARVFRGYGVVVILDHGGGWTSLITGLASASVAVGDSVAQGSPIGRATSGEAPSVTVELRRRDRAIDMIRLLG
ncbi:murein hydrolase activator EnvC [Sphingomonas sp.]|uniref:murein hydrolase activator EnvC family protein n=1 Tax=Sphingomonas sp. TaxID=28214 RepID=UPI0035A8B5C5